MSAKNRSLLGTLLFVGAAQLILVMTVAEALYPGYNMATNYISDLGVGSTALLFNTSVALFGVMALLGAAFGRRSLGAPITLTLVLAGAGAVGVGLFPETTGAPHLICALVTFFFGAVSAIISYRVTRRPLSYFSVVLGVIALAAIVLLLYSPHYDLGIGRGGMERMIAFPSLVWALGFGGFMMGSR
ncbi:MAG TPA: DUF998 domain-containing protein [Candidatus Acidoferrales bacterium]|nr:DUF998 domain-containing protein [Candidatus Acidoferrales bacterium]